MSRRTMVICLVTVTAAVAASLLVSGRKWNPFRPISVVAGGPAATPQPIPPQYHFPLPAATIQAWINNNDFDQIRARTWEVWAGLTADSTQSSDGKPLPIWETWWPGSQLDSGRPSAALLAQPPGPKVHTFEAPRQFRGGTVKRGGRLFTLAVSQDFFPNGFPIAVEPLFDDEYAQFVWTPHKGAGNVSYNYLKDLSKLNSAWSSSTPVTARAIAAFPPPAVSLKPTYMLIYKSGHNPSKTGGGVTVNGMTILPMWKDNLQSQGFVLCVAVPPNPNDGRIGTQINSVPCGNSTLSGVPVVSINAFYSFTLNAQEAQSFGGDAEAGDGTVLLAMHVSTKEIDNWTWQTFWWDNGAHPMGSPPPGSVKGVWRNYEACSAYSMTDKNDPNGPNIVCFNPYLEGNGGAISDSRQSNCMSCHGVARVPAIMNSKVDGNGYPCRLQEHLHPVRSTPGRCCVLQRSHYNRLFLGLGNSLSAARQGTKLSGHSRKQRRIELMSVSYATDIKPLFTPLDREHMLAARHFDLWLYDDVKTWASAILNAVSPPNPTMPPTSSGEPPWTAQMVATFQEWINEGYPP